MKTTVVEMDDREVALTGTAAEQFEQWRGVLEVLYSKEQDPSAVRIVS